LLIFIRDIAHVPKIGKEQAAQNRRRIEAAALGLFTRQGFHGTRTRDIGKKIGLSSGVIYTYFPGKEAIFASLAQRYRKHMAEWLGATLATLARPLDTDDLSVFAERIQSKMKDDPQYLLMLLSDVIEFNNRHFMKSFRNVPQQLNALLGDALQRVRKQPGWRGEDPAFVLASVYLFFFTYALVEKHMQGEQHLGLTDQEAIASLVELLSGGLWGSSPQVPHEESASERRAHFEKYAAQHKANRERIEYLRFLSGRLWHTPPDAPPGRAPPAATPILFLPEIPADRIDDNQLKVEAAALELFTRQGFHGTNIREIAARAGISQGAIYKYYSGKDAIFEGLVRSYRRCMRHFLERVMRSMEDPFSREGLRFFAAAIRSTVYDDAPYWLLMYNDVIEFENAHFANLFHDIPQQFRYALGPIAERTSATPGWCGLDPGLALAIIYLYFCTYFVVERLMHGKQHLGVTEDEAIERLIDIFTSGIWRRRNRGRRPTVDD
jgi:AcrR family transcriptional regulator